jgi:hypothetical protein
VSAYRARGGGVYNRLRVEHRLSLEELALLLLVVCDEEDIDNATSLAAAETRRLVAGQLAVGGRDTLLRAADLRGSDDGSERLAWCRHQVARAYAKDFGAFPDELTRFQGQGEA